MYRYSEKQWNSALLEVGQLRVGTLHDFRKQEHGKGVSDPQEGKKTVSHQIFQLAVPDGSDPSLQSNIDFQALSAFGFLGGAENGRYLCVTGCTFTRKFDEQDVYILCLSRHLSQKTMGEFEKADSCVEVVFPNSFFRLLTRTLNSITPVQFRGLHHVAYGDRNEPWNGTNWGLHPALLKEKKYCPQGELRGIWQPTAGRKIEPVILENRSLASCCRLVSPPAGAVAV